MHYYIIATEEMYNELKKDYHEYFITYEDKLALADYYIESDKFKEFDSYIASLELSYPNLNINCMNLALEFYNLKRQALSIKIIFYSIIIFLGTISISGMVNSINTNLNLRKREFAMLRSMGVSKKSLNKMIILENVFLVLKSFISSTIIVITGYILLNILFNFDSKALKIITPIKFYFKFPWFYSLIAFITVVAIILFLTRFSINKIKKQNIIDAIREYSI